ncbi:MAG: septum site-determining protein MinC [Myxococcota bacterium]
MSTHTVPASDASTCLSPSVREIALHVRFDDTVPVITVPSALAFDDLRAWVREALPAQLSEISGRSSRLDLGDREIKLFDLRRLIHLLRDEFSVEITGLYVRPAEIQRYAERELKLKLFPSDGVAVPEPLVVPSADEPAEEAEVVPDEPTEEYPDSADAEEALEGITLPNDLEPGDLDDVDPELAADDLMELATEAPRRNAPDQGRRTLTVHRTLRSGAVVRFDGDVILFGDVNPGANVIATGNVVVLGALKGMAHAGALGDESFTILAFDFRPTQVRIGRKIAMPPSARKSVPELVVVRGGEIVIEPYTGRFR